MVLRTEGLCSRDRSRVTPGGLTVPLWRCLRNSFSRLATGRHWLSRPESRVGALYLDEAGPRRATQVRMVAASQSSR